MGAKKTFFISTSIPYVNAKPHIGHVLEFVQTDVLARYHRSQGDQVYFLSGTDDNASKNVQAAEAASLAVADYVNQKAMDFKNLLQKLNISNDDFIRTSIDKRHLIGAQKLWLACKKDDIYKKKYKGFYCVGCEEFKTEKDLLNGACPLHPGKKLETVEEENYFFKLSNYQKVLEDLISTDTLKIIPETRKREAMSFIKSGLEDFSISRSKTRSKNWGIPVPKDKNQIIYVWFDALSNYTNALGYGEESENYKKFWENGDDRVHVIGKDINRFHTIYWPAMLMSAGVKAPTKAVIHGFITIAGQKMSKSVGNVIDPSTILDEYGVDATRYIFTREISTFEDGDLTLEKIKEAYNANLANGLGNLVSRILKMAQTHLEKPVEIEESKLPEEYCSYLEKYEIQKAADFVWKEITDIDLQIQQEEPFKAVKEHKETGQALIRNLVHRLYKVAEMLAPLLPETSEKIKNLVKENKMPEKPLFPRKD
ncbi:MAG: methionine--tRNA ligase [bacterium]|nr:methionine--tRNA ligase [bacterium]